MPVQTTNIHKTAAADIGINFGAATFWVVEAGVLVASDLAEGVSAAQSFSVLINHGSISSGSTFGVRFNLNTGRILNAEDGSITGVNGIGVDGISVAAVNFGSIAATNTGVTFLAGSSKGSFDNRGDVYGISFGVTDTSSSTGSTITNSGTVEGEVAGLGFATASAAVTHVVNSGTIRGGTNSILGVTNGALDLRNSGTLVGDILLQTNGKDTLVNSGSIAGNVRLGGGDDSFNGAGGKSGTIFGDAGIDKLTGGAGSETLLGGLGNDVLSGGAGNDRLLGDAGNDKVLGGLGNDVVTGGANNDFFVFNTALSAVSNRDTVTDFNHVSDTFQLENAIFKGVGASGTINAAFFRVGTAAADANDRIIYNRTTGALLYDGDGTGAQAAIQFATLITKPLLTASDFVLI